MGGVLILTRWRQNHKNQEWHGHCVVKLNIIGNVLLLKFYSFKHILFLNIAWKKWICDVYKYEYGLKPEIVTPNQRVPELVLKIFLRSYAYSVIHLYLCSLSWFSVSETQGSLSMDDKVSQWSIYQVLG